MVHGNKPASHEGFEPGQIPEPLFVYVSLDLICSRDRHAFHPRSFRTSSRTSALLEPKVEVFFMSIYLSGRKLLCLGLSGFHLLFQHNRYSAFLLL